MIWLFIGPLLALLFYATRRWPGQAIVLSSALLPFYLLRLKIGSIPTNLLEVVIITQAVAFVLNGPLRQAMVNLGKSTPPFIIVATVLFIFAAMSGVVVSEEPYVSVGILKGWIIIPIIYATLVAAVVAGRFTTALAVTRSLIYSGAIVAVTSLLLWNPPSRLAGIYDVPNSLAMWLAPLLVMAVWQIITRIKEHDLITQGALHTSAGLMMLALLATQSVTGVGAVIIALLIGTVVWLPSPQRRRITRLVTTFAIGAVLLLLFTGRLTYFIQPLRDPTVHSSLSVRQQLWSVSLELIQKSPIWGIGLGQFEPHYQIVLHQRFAQYNQTQPPGSRPPIGEFVFRDPHNLILSFWLNVGVIGLLSFLLIPAAMLYKTGKQSLLITQAILLGFSTMLIIGLVDTIYWKNDLATLYWVLIALESVRAMKMLSHPSN